MGCRPPTCGAIGARVRYLYRGGPPRNEGAQLALADALQRLVDLCRVHLALNDVEDGDVAAPVLRWRGHHSSPVECNRVEANRVESTRRRSERRSAGRERPPGSDSTGGFPALRPRFKAALQGRASRPRFKAALQGRASRARFKDALQGRASRTRFSGRWLFALPQRGFL